MRPRRLLAAFTGLFWVTPLVAQDEPTVVGVAYDENQRQVLYQELHYCNESGVLCSVDYVSPDGTLIANKQLDYSLNPVGPTLEFQDFRSSKNLSVEQTPTDLVVDAGFDNFIRGQWSTLAEGETVEFEFLVVGYDNPFKMRVQVDDNRSCELQQLCLTVALQSWFLRLLADPIELSYSVQDRRLLRFKGVSNIADNDGKGQNVDILYRYPDRALDISPKLNGSSEDFIF